MIDFNRVKANNTTVTAYKGNKLIGTHKTNNPYWLRDKFQIYLAQQGKGGFLSYNLPTFSDVCDYELNN